MNGKNIPVGTGFFLGEKIVEEAPEYMRVLYLVTAKHVLEGIRTKLPDAPMGIRINTSGGKAVDLKVPPESWYFHPTDNTVDAVITPVASVEGIKIVSLPVEMAMNDGLVKENGIGIGDEVSVVGLFHKYSGKESIMPIVRTGNIAMLPAEPIEVGETGKRYLMEAYLIELRSIGGLSGSPVFVHTSRYHEHKIHHALTLMGLMHGHWNTAANSIDTPLNQGGEPLNVGIGIVVPIHKILEITQQKTLMEAKEKGKKEYSEKHSPEPTNP